jgi:hypothetical protein
MEVGPRSLGIRVFFGTIKAMGCGFERLNPIGISFAETSKIASVLVVWSLSVLSVDYPKKIG